MSAFWKALTHGSSINQLMITVIFLTTLMPAHYHLHHLDSTDATVHEHAFDLHFITASVDQSHHDEDTSIFAATPDVIVKKGSFDIYPYLLLTIILVLLTVFHRAIIRPDNKNIILKRHCPYFSPPLRAPPRHSLL